MFPIGRKMFIHLLESWASPHSVGMKNTLFPHPFHWALPVEHDIVWYGISLCQCGSSAPVADPPNPSCTSSLCIDWLCMRRAGQSGRQTLDAVQADFGVKPKPRCGVSPVLAKAQPPMGCNEENSLHPNQTQHPHKRSDKPSSNQARHYLHWRLNHTESLVCYSLLVSRHL